MKTKRTDRKLKFETLQLHVGQEQRTRQPMPGPFRFIRLHRSYFMTAIMQRQDLIFLDAGNIYGRLTNPTEDVFERRVAALEGGAAALAVASGAAAIAYTFQNLAQSGDHIVAAKIFTAVLIISWRIRFLNLV